MLASRFNPSVLNPDNLNWVSSIDFICEVFVTLYGQSLCYN
jgi:hypothetical protein